MGLAKNLAEVYSDPLGYVMMAFPWETEENIQIVKLPPQLREQFGCEYGPDEWAREFLDNLGEQIRERNFQGRKAVKPIQFSTASGHGIGKSTLSAWLIKFVMDTRPYCKGIVTANTDGQLKTKTWAELGKWHRMSLTSHWFEYSAGRGAMALYHKKFKQEWRVDGQTCREENSEAFAGLHAANSTPFYLFDEASGIPDKIFEVREGGLTDGEPMVFDFGNPTRNSGRFFENCAGRFRHRFNVRSIDSRSVAITNKTQFEEWAEDYGEDSDFFKVRVRGVFPSMGSLQFIANDKVEEAGNRDTEPIQLTTPLAIGVDVARFGDDDTVIYPRLGMDARSFQPRRLKGADTVQVVGAVIETVNEFKRLGHRYGGLFIDEGGVGGGVVDQLRHLNYDVMGVNFGGNPMNRMKYRYRVDEMWGRMRDALADRLAIPSRKMPHGLDLYEELTQREFGYTEKGSLIRLEQKSKMKERGLRSPDLADALALTFAMDLAPADINYSQAIGSNRSDWDYNPHGEEAFQN